MIFCHATTVPVISGFTFFFTYDLPTAQPSGTLHVFSRIVASGEPASYLVDVAAANNFTAISLFSGALSASPFSGHSDAGTDGPDGSTLVIPGSSVVAEKGGLLVMPYAASIGAMTNSTELSTVTSRTSEIYDANSGNLFGGKRIAALSVQTDLPDGALADRTFTMNTNAQNRLGSLIALRPAESVILPEGARLTRLAGAYTDITDDPNSPDANWLTVT